MAISQNARLFSLRPSLLSMLGSLRTYTRHNVYSDTAALFCPAALDPYTEPVSTMRAHSNCKALPASFHPFDDALARGWNIGVPVTERHAPINDRSGANEKCGDDHQEIFVHPRL